VRQAALTGAGEYAGGSRRAAAMPIRSAATAWSAASGRRRGGRAVATA